MKNHDSQEYYFLVQLISIFQINFCSTPTTERQPPATFRYGGALKVPFTSQKGSNHIPVGASQQPNYNYNLGAANMGGRPAIGKPGIAYGIHTETSSTPQTTPVTTPQTTPMTTSQTTPMTTITTTTTPPPPPTTTTTRATPTTKLTTTITPTTSDGESGSGSGSGAYGGMTTQPSTEGPATFEQGTVATQHSNWGGSYWDHRHGRKKKVKQGKMQPTAQAWPATTPSVASAQQTSKVYSKPEIATQTPTRNPTTATSTTVPPTTATSTTVPPTTGQRTWETTTKVTPAVTTQIVETPVPEKVVPCVNSCPPAVVVPPNLIQNNPHQQQPASGSNGKPNIQMIFVNCTFGMPCKKKQKKIKHRKWRGKHHKRPAVTTQQPVRTTPVHLVTTPPSAQTATSFTPTASSGPEATYPSIGSPFTVPRLAEDDTEDDTNGGGSQGEEARPAQPPANPLQPQASAPNQGPKKPVRPPTPVQGSAPHQPPQQGGRVPPSSPTTPSSSPEIPNSPQQPNPQSPPQHQPPPQEAPPPQPPPKQHPSEQPPGQPQGPLSERPPNQVATTSMCNRFKSCKGMSCQVCPCISCIPVITIQCQGISCAACPGNGCIPAIPTIPVMPVVPLLNTSAVVSKQLENSKAVEMEQGKPPKEPQNLPALQESREAQAEQGTEIQASPTPTQQTRSSPMTQTPTQAQMTLPEVEDLPLPTGRVQNDEEQQATDHGQVKIQEQHYNTSRQEQNKTEQGPQAHLQKQQNPQQQQQQLQQRPQPQLSQAQQQHKQRPQQQHSQAQQQHKQRPQQQHSQAQQQHKQRPQQQHSQAQQQHKQRPQQQHSQAQQQHRKRPHQKQLQEQQQHNQWRQKQSKWSQHKPKRPHAQNTKQHQYRQGSKQAPNQQAGSVEHQVAGPYGWHNQSEANVNVASGGQSNSQNSTLSTVGRKPNGKDNSQDNKAEHNKHRGKYPFIHRTGKRPRPYNSEGGQSTNFTVTPAPSTRISPIQLIAKYTKEPVTTSVPDAKSYTPTPGFRYVGVNGPLTRPALGTLKYPLSAVTDEAKNQMQIQSNQTFNATFESNQIVQQPTEQPTLPTMQHTFTRIPDFHVVLTTPQLPNGTNKGEQTEPDAPYEEDLATPGPAPTVVPTQVTTRSRKVAALTTETTQSPAHTNSTRYRTGETQSAQQSRISSGVRITHPIQEKFSKGGYTTDRNMTKASSGQATYKTPTKPVQTSHQTSQGSATKGQYNPTESISISSNYQTTNRVGSTTGQGHAGTTARQGGQAGTTAKQGTVGTTVGQEYVGTTSRVQKNEEQGPYQQSVETTNYEKNENQTEVEANSPTVSANGTTIAGRESYTTSNQQPTTGHGNGNYTVKANTGDKELIQGNTNGPTGSQPTLSANSISTASRQSYPTYYQYPTTGQKQWNYTQATRAEDLYEDIAETTGNNTAENRYTGTSSTHYNYPTNNTSQQHSTTTQKPMPEVYQEKANETQDMEDKGKTTTSGSAPTSKAKGAKTEGYDEVTERPTEKAKGKYPTQNGATENLHTGQAKSSPTGKLGTTFKQTTQQGKMCLIGILLVTEVVIQSCK